MERPTRRSATAANGLSSTSSNGTNSNNSNNSSRRRRREADRDGAMSDGGDTDSSTVAVEMGTSARSSKTSATKKSARSTAAARGKSLAGVDAIVEAAATDAVDDAGRADDDDVNFEDPVQEDDAPGANVDAQEEEPPLVTGYATRARRERSQSVVSTTSDTSSIASTSSRPGHGEDDDEDEDGEPPRPEVHTEKLAELEKKKKMVEDGSLAEYCRRVAEFKEERNRLLQSAEWHKNLQLKNTADLFGFEVQRGHNLWQESKDTLKREMLTRADTLLRTLRGELATLVETGRLPTHVVQPKKTLALPPRKVAVAVMPGGGDVGGAEETLRCSVEDKEEADDEADHEEEDEEEQQDRSIYKRRKVVATSAPMPANVLRLPLDTIYSDLASILTTRETASAAIHTALPAARLEVRVDRRRLLCGKYVFEEGDEVVVTAAVLKEDYIGVISSVSDQELFVKLSTGQKVRVAVEHIAYRRCEIRPFLRGSAGIQSLQSSGWVECEPF